MKKSPFFTLKPEQAKNAQYNKASAIDYKLYQETSKLKYVYIENLYKNL